MTEGDDCETRASGRGYRPGGMQIQPRSFGENLNGWFRAIGDSWRPLLILCAVVYVPLGLLTIALLLIPDVLGAYFDLVVPEGEIQSPAELMELLGPLIWVGLIGTLLQLVAMVFVYVAAGRAVAVRANEGQPTTSELMRFAMSRLGAGAGAGLVLLVGFVVLFALVTLIGWALISALGVDFFPVFVIAVVALTALVVVIWISVSISLYSQAIAMENATATESLASSFRLVRGRWWPTLGFELVTGLIVSAVAQVVSIVLIPLFFFGFVAPAVFAVAYGLATMLQGPVAAGIGLAYAVWYVELRSREAPLTSENLV